MRYTTVVSALAASALAAPALVKKNEPATIEPAPLCERFSVAFEVDGSYVSANAVKNGSNILLMAERLSVYPGTPAYINSSNPTPDDQFDYVALDFVLEDGVYGAFAADVGDNYGVQVPITLNKNYQQFEWLVNNGSIGHELHAAPNSLFACNGTLENGEQNVFLSFGDARFNPISGPPEGCAYTKVIQNYNIEGGLRPSS